MEKQYLYNKIKGTLVAAGMGDAMGAPSEAWSRDEIIKNYGGPITDFIDPSLQMIHLRCMKWHWQSLNLKEILR